jgi:hypothetical protein
MLRRVDWQVVTDVLSGRMAFFVRVQRFKRNDYWTVQMLDISVGVNRQAIGKQALPHNTKLFISPVHTLSQ